MAQSTKGPTVLMSAQDFKAQQIAQSMEESALAQKDTTIPGGVFIVNGVKVNANGHPVGAVMPTEAEVQEAAARRYEEQRTALINANADVIRAEENARVQAAMQAAAAAEAAQAGAAKVQEDAAKAQAEADAKAQKEAEEAAAAQVAEQEAQQKALLEAQAAQAQAQADEAQAQATQAVASAGGSSAKSNKSGAK